MPSKIMIETTQGRVHEIQVEWSLKECIEHFEDCWSTDFEFLRIASKYEFLIIGKKDISLIAIDTIQEDLPNAQEA